MRRMLLLITVTFVAALPPSAQAREPDLGKMEELIQQLEQILEGLQKRVAALEAALAQAAPADGGAAPAPAVPKPDAEASEPPSGATDIRETYDRFTGKRTLLVVSGPVRASIKDDRGRTLPMTLLWEIYQEDDQSVVHQLYVESASPERLWPQGTVAYLLEDEHRSRIELQGYLAAREGRDMEYVSIRFRKSALERFTDAEKVEARIGEWELEIPRAFRQQAAEANRRAETPPK